MAVSGRGISGTGGIGNSKVKAPAQPVTGATRPLTGPAQRVTSATRIAASSPTSGGGAGTFTNSLVPGTAAVIPQRYICPKCKEEKTITFQDVPGAPRCRECGTALVKGDEAGVSKVERSAEGNTRGRGRSGKQRKSSS